MEPSIRYFMTEVRVLDWAKSVCWYRDVLGLRVVMEDHTGRFALLEARAGGGRVAIKGGQAGEAIAGRGAVRLVFEVADLEAVMADLVAKGERFEGPESSAEGYREIRLQDPDGTPIGLFAWVNGNSGSP